MNKNIGKETKNAIKNFKISNHKLQEEFYKAIIEIKRAGAIAHYKIDNKFKNKKIKIVKACDQLLKKYDPELFLIDVFQTGSATSSNMNVNEVIANMCSKQDMLIHPNDDVNWGQSSNDVIPSAINISNLLLIDPLIDKCKKLNNAFTKIINENKETYKLGRTHLQDAVPMSVAMEFGAYSNSITKFITKLKTVKSEMMQIPIGGTAIGTGVASNKKFGKFLSEELSKRLGFKINNNTNLFSKISFREEQVSLMNELSLAASSLIKISNDLRILSSGPNAGLNEIVFKKLQAGSSVMPGKVNPVIMEMMIQVCSLIIGRNITVNIGNQNGPLQLNMMLPLIAFISIDSLKILTNAIDTFASKGIDKIVFNKKTMENNIWKSASIITILKNHPKMGYDMATKLVKESKANKITIIELIKKKNIFTEKEIKSIFNIKKMVKNEK